MLLNLFFVVFHIKRTQSLSSSPVPDVTPAAPIVLSPLTVNMRGDGPFRAPSVCGTVWKGVVISSSKVLYTGGEPSGPGISFAGPLLIAALASMLALRTSGLAPCMCLGTHPLLNLNSLSANNCSLSSLLAVCITEGVGCNVSFSSDFLKFFFSFLFLTY